MRPADPVAPARGATGRPWIVDQRPGPNGTVRVTWATSSLDRITLTVPETAWIQGHHAPAGELTAAILSALDPAGIQPVGDVSEPRENVNDADPQ